MQSHDLTKQFNRAVDAFWSTYASFAARMDCLAARGKLMDAADGVLIARDDLQGVDIPDKVRDDMTREIADMGECLSKNGIALNSKPVQTSTGRMTYRIIAKPRFDA